MRGGKILFGDEKIYNRKKNFYLLSAEYSVRILAKTIKAKVLKIILD
jgi:hypothetical protein